MGIKRECPDRISSTEQKYNAANIIQPRHKSHLISRNDVFPPVAEKKKPNSILVTSCPQHPVPSAWTNFPLWKVVAKTLISRWEFKSGTEGKTAVGVINHSDPSSADSLEKIFQKFVKQVSITRVGCLYLGQYILLGTSGISFLWTCLATNWDWGHGRAGLKLMRNN